MDDGRVTEVTRVGSRKAAGGRSRMSGRDGKEERIARVVSKRGIRLAGEGLKIGRG